MDKMIPQIGKILTGDVGRDAIHIAVAPVIAGTDLRPGGFIGFIGDAYTVGITSNPIGIVDPFLKNTVKRGESFYMFLLPNTITSLRHEWTHPAFEKEDEIASFEPTFQKLKGPTKEMEWVENYAKNIGSSYDELMQGARDWVEHGHYLSRGGQFEGVSVPDEFWEKFEEIENMSVDEDNKTSFFSCSC